MSKNNMPLNNSVWKALFERGYIRAYTFKFFCAFALPFYRISALSLTLMHSSLAQSGDSFAAYVERH